MRLSQSDLFNDAGADLKVVQPSNQLQPADWPPKLEALTQGWQQLLGHFWHSPTGVLLDQKMRAGLSAGQVFFPQAVYKAFALTPFENVKLVVLGQDPYHGPDQAEGLAFSVGPGQKIPPSLRNIFKEIQRDLGVAIPTGPRQAAWCDGRSRAFCSSIRRSRLNSHCRPVIASGVGKYLLTKLFKPLQPTLSLKHFCCGARTPKARQASLMH
jgi:hypothetical protein